MKLLIIQENGRHEKNRNYRECFSLKRSFEKNGFECIVWGLGHHNFNDDFNLLESWADVIFLLENYTPTWLPLDKIKNSKKIKIFWSIDSHCVLDQHINLVKQIKPDFLLNSTKSYLPNFKDYCGNTLWFPNCYDDTLITPMEIEKNIDVGFCGNINNRGEWINYLNIFNIKKDIFVIGEDMVRTINSYKIHFNRNISNDINYRTFETTGCKTLLVTNYTEGLELLFNINQDIVVYETKDDLIDKIKFYLENETERNLISNNGYLKSKNNHTYEKRISDFIKELQT
jgi:hypothetical protein